MWRRSFATLAAHRLYIRCTVDIDWQTIDLETVLGSTHTRNLFLDDLMELKEFLAQRISELSKESSSMLVYGQVRMYSIYDSL